MEKPCSFVPFCLLWFLSLSNGLPLFPQTQVDHHENVELLDETSQGVDPIPYVREDLNNTKKYLVIDDMIISKDPSKAGLVNAAWPSGIVPYSFAMTIIPQQRGMILQAIAEIATRTCIQFRPAKRDDTSWILFQNDPLNQGCSSFVGWQNRKNQPVQLSTACSKGNAVHEIIHALGFYHEHTRNDRDEYVTVIWDNVHPSQINNFKREKDMEPPPQTTTYESPYNYASIMHYGKTYFSKNGKETIQIVSEDDRPSTYLGVEKEMGQREYLSAGDIEMLNKKYDCPTSLPGGGGGEESTATPPEDPSQIVCQQLPIPVCKPKKKE